jgi:hypothetical protein
MMAGCLLIALFSPMLPIPAGGKFIISRESGRPQGTYWKLEHGKLLIVAEDSDGQIFHSSEIGTYRKTSSGWIYDAGGYKGRIRTFLFSMTLYDFDGGPKKYRRNIW